MIYTSYFAKLNKLPSDIVPISIALKPPSWYKGWSIRNWLPASTF